jgi:hypothetical protein
MLPAQIPVHADDTMRKGIIIGIVLILLLFAALSLSLARQPTQSSTTTLPTLSTIPSNKYSLAPSFVSNSSDYSLVNVNVSKSNRLYVYGNNTTAIYQTLLLNKSPIRTPNTAIQVYSIVELFPTVAQANAAFSFKKEDILSAIGYNSTEFSTFPTPAIGNMTFGFSELFNATTGKLFVVQFAIGNAFVRVGTYETQNSSSTLPIALAQRMESQISS